MSEQLLWDFAALAEPAPAWAVECFYCHPDELGNYDEARHLDAHLAITCEICGETSPNRLLFEMNHGVNLGASWGHGRALCTALSLQLNHLSYDIRHGRTPFGRDLIPISLGWRIGPDGHQIPPAEWPPLVYPDRTLNLRKDGQ